MGWVWRTGSTGDCHSGARDDTGATRLIQWPATVPAFATAVLLPFGDRIIIDGILTSPDIRLSFGAGARRSFETQYSSARAQGQIRTSLLPTTPPVSTKRPPVTRARSVAAAPPILGTWQITETEL